VIIGLASPSVAESIDDGLHKIKTLMGEAAEQGAEIVCFPEAYLPGLRGLDFDVPPFDEPHLRQLLAAVCDWARRFRIAAIVGTERIESAGRQIVSYVIDASGEIQGFQTKNQIDPSEDRLYVPGNTRRVFTINGVKLGIAICHEGWRYPETVRWAAVRGAKIVFHPQHTGSQKDGVALSTWGSADAPYYEKAMLLRSIENTIYFASVNYALRYQESATSLIDPAGSCQAYLPYGQEGVLVQEIDPAKATGLLAARFAPARHREESP
jgi:predicted amidohydrolase